MNVREEIVELINKRLIYSNEQNWNGLKSEEFSKKLPIDISSQIDEAIDTPVQAIFDMRKAGIERFVSINHLGENYPNYDW